MANHLWPPFTQMQGMNPVIIERGDGAVVWDVEGKEYIDAFASLWTVNVGHGRQEIFDAIAAQAQQLACYHMFLRATNRPSIELAAKVAEKLPSHLNRVFLTLGGGDAIETAFKMARQYWRNEGKGSKYMVLFRDRAYHGTTFGVTSAQGLSVNRQSSSRCCPASSRSARRTATSAPGARSTAAARWSARRRSRRRSSSTAPRTSAR